MLYKISTLILVGVCLFLGVKSHCQGNQLQDVQEQLANVQTSVEVVNGELEAIPQQVKTLTALSNRTLTVLKRLPSGEFVEEGVSGTYVPPEGSIVVTTHEDPSVADSISILQQQLEELGQGGLSEEEMEQWNAIQAQIDSLQAHLTHTEVDVENKGFTFVPEIGYGFTGEHDVRVGGRFFYWNRFGASAMADLYEFDSEEWLNGLNLQVDYRVPRFDNLAPSIGLHWDEDGFGITGGLNFLLK